MATWAEVSNNPIYTALPEEEKRGVADRFFSKVVSINPTYMALPDEEKQGVKTRFYMKAKFAPPEVSHQESFMQKLGRGVGKFTEPKNIPGVSKPIRTIADFVGRATEAGAEKLGRMGAGTPFEALTTAGQGVLTGIGGIANIGASFAKPSPADVAMILATGGGSLLAKKTASELASKEIAALATRLKLLANAPPAVKAVEIAKLSQQHGPKAVNEALSIAELQARTGTPEKARAAVGFVTPQEFRGPLIPTEKPFTLRAGLPEQNRAALEAFRARLPQGPEIAPRAAQEATLAPKPAIPLPMGQKPVLAPQKPILQPDFAGNIRLGKYSPQAQEGIILANKVAGVAERTPQTIAEMRITGATPEAQVLFDAVAKGKSGELAGKTQLVRETLEKEAIVFKEQADVAIKAGGDELDNLIKTSPAIQTASQLSKVAQTGGQTLAAFKQNASTALGKSLVSSLEKIKAGLRSTKSPFAQKNIEAIEALQKALDKKQLELAKLPAAYRAVMGVTDKAYTLWINSILSNPLTHVRNIGGNTLFIVAKPVEKIMAAATDNVISLFTGKAPTHTFREAGAMVKAGVKYMVGKGEKLPFAPTKAGFGKFDRPLQEIQGRAGKIIGAPTKALEIEDNISKNMVAQMEYAALKSNGVMGDELTKRVMDEAAYRTYQDEAGEIVKWIMKGRDKVPGFKWVVPFVRTPAKLLERGLERTPLGILKVAGKAAKGAYKEAGGQAALAADIGNTILGSAASALLAMEYGKGNISGAWPTDRRESTRWRAEGKKPYSYRTKDGWVSLDRIEPFGAVVKTTISTIDTFKIMSGEVLDKVAMAAAARLGKELVRMSAFNGFQNFAQSISDPARFAGKTAASIASGFAPGAAKFATDYIPGLKDPLMRQREGAVEMGQAKIPFAAERLKPQLDIWGQPIRKEAFFTAVSRARESKELDLLKTLDLPVPKYPSKMFGYHFTTDEAFKIHQKAGPIIKNFLNQYAGRKILNRKGLIAEIRAGIEDINNAVAQLEVLKIPFTPNRNLADKLSTEINKDIYKKHTPKQRRADLIKIIFGTPK